MPDSSKKKLTRATIIYWVMLAYILAALVWWFISLLQQNRVMRDYKILHYISVTDSTKNPGVYHAEIRKINEEYKRGKTKFYGEGGFFFLLILVGAAFVYR